MSVQANKLQTLQPTEVLAGRYEILRLLAEGGMGSVYMARQLGLGRKVAIKTLREDLRDRPELLERLRTEAAAVQRLTHPNTVRVYDVGELEDGRLYLVMEYLEGRTLDRVLQKVGPLSQPTVQLIARQVLKSLVEAHGHGLVHRDIKPSNLMICRQLGEVNLVKVLDFGLAQAVRRRKKSGRTEQGTAGTPHYMAPEQVLGQPLDGRADLYSLALTLYELATGRVAYDGESVYAVASRHLDKDPLVLPPELAHTRLGDVIARAARKDVGERYASAQAMLDALRSEADLTASDTIPVLDLVDSSDLLPARDDDELSEALNRVTTQDMTRMAVDTRPSGRGRVAVVLGSVAWVLVMVLAMQSGDGPGPRALSFPAASLSPAPAPSPSAAAVGPEEGEEAESVEPTTAVLNEELPERIRLAVETEPPGAEVTLDGRPLCTTPCEREQVGRRKTGLLTVRLEGFDTVYRAVDLAADVRLPIVLVRVADGSEPAGEGGAAVETASRSTRPREAGSRSEHAERSVREVRSPEPQEPAPPAVVPPEPAGPPTEQGNDDTSDDGQRRRLPIDF